MLLRDFVTESAIAELRVRVKDKLSESINDYMAVTIAQLKNKKPEELFKGSNPMINLENLASIIAGLKVISNREYRGAMTAKDIGINPNSAKELYKLLDDVAKDGKNPKDVEDVFRALKTMAPTMYKKEVEALEDLKSEDDAKRKEAITSLVTFATKIGQTFGKIKAAAQSGKSAPAAGAAA